MFISNVPPNFTSKPGFKVTSLAASNITLSVFFTMTVFCVTMEFEAFVSSGRLLVFDFTIFVPSQNRTSNVNLPFISFMSLIYMFPLFPFDTKQYGLVPLLKEFRPACADGYTAVACFG